MTILIDLANSIYYLFPYIYLLFFQQLIQVPRAQDNSSNESIKYYYGGSILRINKLGNTLHTKKHTYKDKIQEFEPIFVISLLLYYAQYATCILQ